GMKLLQAGQCGTEVAHQWTRTTNKKVALFVPLSCFHWHISCRFWSFDDITETPGSAWAITESDSSFPLCSLNAFYKTNIPPFR
ncbi:hypothetical protein ACEWA0_23425, partial [Vibrio parahaemolyticus]